MKVTQHISLQPYNTFGLNEFADTLIVLEKPSDLPQLRELISEHKELPLVLGSGSNMLLGGPIRRPVIKVELKGMAIVEEDAYTALVFCAAGVNWHDLVLFALDHQLGGIENLSLIPGTAGAAPMQNIGAYGVELKDTFSHLEAVHLVTGEHRIFNKADCEFGYRESVFKHREAGQWLITGIFLLLQKQAELKTSYGTIREELEKRGITQPGIRDISEVVCAIRRSKLPDPAQIGNAGSFFKNPEIPIEQFAALQMQFPELVAFPAGPGKMKLAAAWLIEQCGWKGCDLGGYGVHDRQALVLVNRGGASGAKLAALAQDIIQSVQDRFQIKLHAEVNLISC